MTISQSIVQSDQVHDHKSDPINPKQYTRWAHTFWFTDDHMSVEELCALRTSYDQSGSAAYEALNGIINKNRNPGKETVNFNDHRGNNLLDVLRIHHQEAGPLQEFWNQMYTVPDWVDWKQIERGQMVWGRYALPILTYLVFYGFVRGSAVSGVPEVLSRTITFTPRKLLTQFMGNVAWLIKVTNSLESLQPGGEGHSDSIRVRLIHASVRHHILKVVESRPTYFDGQKLGLPINDYNSLHVLSIMCGSLLDTLPKIDITLSKQEEEDYVALFRYLAYLNGVPSDRLSNCQMSLATMESFLLTEELPSLELKTMLSDIIGLVDLQSPTYLRPGFWMAGLHQLNGAEYCATLGVARPSLYHKMAFDGFCKLLYLLSLAQYCVQALDSYMITYWRTKFLVFLSHRPALVESLNSFFEKMKVVSKPHENKTGNILGLLAELLFVVIYLISVLFKPILLVVFTYTMYNLRAEVAW